MCNILQALKLSISFNQIDHNPKEITYPWHEVCKEKYLNMSYCC